MRKPIISLMTSRPSFGNFFQKRTFVNTQHWEFIEESTDIEDIHHYSVTPTSDDNFKTITSKLKEIITSPPNSLIFLTQKSRILRRSDDNPNFYIPLKREEINNNQILIEWIKKRWLRPDGGHTCMTITDDIGSTLDHTTVSMRPSRVSVIEGKYTLHPHHYSKGPSYVNTSIHTSLHHEIELLATKMMKDSSIIAHLTIVPLTQSKTDINKLLENIRSARSQKLYNLCSIIVKNSDINTISNAELKAHVLKLKSIAETIDDLKDFVRNDNESILAALACTQILVQACVGDPHQVDKDIYPDQDTQTVVVYCTIALTGARSFLNFAKNINFLDDASSKTKPKQ